MIKITIPGEPVRRISPTFSKYGTYDSQKSVLEGVKWQVLEQARKYPGMPFPKDCAIDLEFNFFFPIPKGKESLHDWGLLPHIDTPDVDNLLKFYGDALKKICFEDDRQIDKLYAFKCYDKNPRTEILIVAKPPTVDDQVKEVLSMVSPSQLTELTGDLNFIADSIHVDYNVDYENIAYIVLEFAEKHADSLKKLTKKFPGLATVLRERLVQK